MNYSISQINRTFLIKVFGYDNEGNKVNRLVGVSGLLDLIGLELANKLLQRAYNCQDDKCVCRLRRGLQVSFYVH